MRPYNLRSPKFLKTEPMSNVVYWEGSCPDTLGGPSGLSHAISLPRLLLLLLTSTKRLAERRAFVLVRQDAGARLVQGRGSFRCGHFELLCCARVDGGGVKATICEASPSLMSVMDPTGGFDSGELFLHGYWVVAVLRVNSYGTAFCVTIQRRRLLVSNVRSLFLAGCLSSVVDFMVSSSSLSCFAVFPCQSSCRRCLVSGAGICLLQLTWHKMLGLCISVIDLLMVERVLILILELHIFQ
jgi:hypothetical protein